ncbi:MAG: hypothetical protein KF784_08935 [Fimbriimonadaceae bacterium]|nr:hypothetical protein [Fimbriimonadaceae bacterium]
MITTVLVTALLAVGQIQGGGQAGGDQTPKVSPSELLSKMFAHYASAKTLSGRITLTTTAMNQSGKIVTDVQYEYPNKIYIRQQKNVGNARSWLLVSDGKAFSYDAPDLPFVKEDQRLAERTKTLGKDFGVKEIYGIGAVNLGDRSTALDILISRNEDLKIATQQWQTVVYKGMIEYKEEKVHVVTGDWRLNQATPSTGQYRFYLTDQGELKQFAKTEKVGSTTGQSVDVLFVWEVEAEVNGKVDQSYFRIK